MGRSRTILFVKSWKKFGVGIRCPEVNVGSVEISSGSESRSRKLCQRMQSQAIDILGEQCKQQGQRRTKPYKRLTFSRIVFEHRAYG